MSNEDIIRDQRISTSHCEVNYGHYALFAMYPLRIAVLNSDAYDLEVFTRIFERSGKNHRSNAKFAMFVDRLVYEDKNYFNVDETRFLLQILAPCERLSNEQIELGLRAVRTDVKRGRNMLKSHARILSKAITYWRMHFDDNYERWIQEFGEAYSAWQTRRDLNDDYQYFCCRECNGE